MARKKIGAGDEVIMSIAGHVSRAMRSRYSYVRMEAKRRDLDEIAARQCAADEKAKVEAVVFRLTESCPWARLEAMESSASFGTRWFAKTGISTQIADCAY